MKKSFLPAAMLGAALLAAMPMAHAAPEKHKTAPKAKPATKAGRVITTKTGLKYQDLRVGKGAVARAGQHVFVHYRGRLTNGTVFDESYKRGTPFDFDLGAQPPQVIKGWDQGVAGMRVGGKRKLTIPSHLGYGERGAGGVIPPNATLIFDVELLKIQ